MESKNMQEEVLRPVTVLTGFLGSGKTTYLNAIRVANPGKRYAIIENEIGEVNIDSQLLHPNDDPLIELQDGCLCCTLNDDLYAALDQLNQRTSDFDELIIECTGLALPATVIIPFTVYPVFKRVFPLKRTVCMVDAELIEEQLQERDEALRQITAADVILINKTEYVNAEYVLSLKNELAKLNPLGSVFLERAKGIFPFGELEEVRYTTHPPLFFMANGKNLHTESMSLLLNTTGMIHKDITVKTYFFDHEFNFIHLYFFLSKLATLHKDKIYRMKGVAFKSEERRKIVIQAVGSRIDVGYGGDWEESETRQNTFVFIGKDIDGLRVDEYLNELLIISINKVS